MVHQSKLQCGLSVDHVTGQHDLHGTPFANQVREALRPAAARDDAEVDLGLRKSGGFARRAEVAGQGELIPAAEAEAVDHSYDGFRERIHRIEKSLFVK